jgi:hypothetical protein
MSKQTMLKLILFDCLVNDNGDAKFTKFSVLPVIGRKGETFNIEYSYESLNGTAPGEMVLEISTLDRIPFIVSFISESDPPGRYMGTISISATPDPQCDPKRRKKFHDTFYRGYFNLQSFNITEPCEKWLPGMYNVTLKFCNGECGSKFPHSAVYDTGKGAFQLIK